MVAAYFGEHLRVNAMEYFHDFLLYPISRKTDTDLLKLTEKMIRTVILHLFSVW
jgi:hypothetical protein